VNTPQEKKKTLIQAPQLTPERHDAGGPLAGLCVHFARRSTSPYDY